MSLPQCIRVRVRVKVRFRDTQRKVITWDIRGLGTYGDWGHVGTYKKNHVLSSHQRQQ